MSVTSTRSVLVTFTGDISGNNAFGAASNAVSAGQIQIVTLASGDNTVTVPTGGTTPTCCTIVKPSTNAVVVKLKGAGGDTGVILHLTDPDCISLGSSVTSFILNAGSTLTGVRLIWS